jgi:serine/threonine protein phosphatase PrpC|tara:strand:+ start:297 stop:989 length:693 start_codon:yes stop_codon:yes gene_type:complete
VVGIGHLNVSVIGPAHLSNGQHNQDATLIRPVARGWVAVVCDGLGSKPHAGLGSRLACKAVINIINQVDFTIGSKELITLIYQQWLNKLGCVKAKDAMTTCLFCWLSHDSQVRTFQLGDGLIITSKKSREIIDTNDFGNETTGLGKSKKFSDWKVTHQQLGKGDVIALMTDGISDDIKQGMEIEFVHVISERIKGKNIRRSKTWLKNELRSWATPKHTDDKSIALLVINK